MGDAQVHQACLLASGDDLDGVSQRALGGHQEGLWGGQPAHRVGRQGTHPVRGDVADALAEPRQTVEGARARFPAQRAARVQALAQAHGLAQPVDHPQLAEQVLGHHHVEAVGAQVDRGQKFAVLQGRGHPREGAVRSVWRAHHPAVRASSQAWAECGGSPPGSSWT